MKTVDVKIENRPETLTGTYYQWETPLTQPDPLPTDYHNVEEGKGLGTYRTTTVNSVQVRSLNNGCVGTSAAGSPSPLPL